MPVSVKSTRTMTRAEAESKYVDLRLNDASVLRMLRAEAVAMDDVELENVLERLNDASHGGEGFENYSIRERT